MIHCVINLDTASSSRVFNEFDYVFLSNIFLESIKLLFFKKIPKILIYFSLKYLFIFS